MPAAGTQFEPDDEDNLDETGEDSKLVKDLRRQLKEQAKRDAEREKQLTELTNRDRQRTLTEALTAKGVSPKLARFYPADAETTDEAIAGWLTENADAFGAAATTETTAPDPGEGKQEEPAEPVVDPATEWAYRRMQAASLVGGTATTHEQDLLRQVRAAKSPEELTAFLRTARA